MNEMVPDLFTVDQQIEQHAQNVERIQRDAIFEIGRELAEAQALFRYKPNGGFTEWLAVRLPHIPQSSAYQAIQICKNIDPALFPDSRNISPLAWAEVAKAAPDVQALIAEKVAAGEIFTAAEVKELRAEAAAEAVEVTKKEADEIRDKLAKARKALSAKDENAQALEDQIAELSAKLKGHEDRISEYQQSLPTPREAEKIAAQEGGLIFANDGKFHSGATPERQQLTDEYLRVWRLLAEIANPEIPSPINVVAGCDPTYRAQLGKFCQRAAVYIAQIEEALDVKQP